jgi:hypothetical protein
MAISEDEFELFLLFDFLDEEKLTLILDLVKVDFLFKDKARYFAPYLFANS